MTRIDKIKAYKQSEIKLRELTQPINLLEQSISFNSKCNSLKSSLLNSKNGIIAEFKRRCPSNGIINMTAEIENTTIGYLNSGASALSISTDNQCFGGKNKDLISVKRICSYPILRKDFIVNEYQIIESRSIGADAITLIAAMLSKSEISQFTKLAIKLGLEIVLEIHNIEDLEKFIPEISIISVNNKTLNTFDINLEKSFKILPLLPKNTVRISESGINTAEDIMKLKLHGYNGFILGENFMKTQSPNSSFKTFIDDLNALQNATSETKVNTIKC